MFAPGPADAVVDAEVLDELEEEWEELWVCRLVWVWVAAGSEERWGLEAAEAVVDWGVAALLFWALALWLVGGCEAAPECPCCKVSVDSVTVSVSSMCPSLCTYT